MKKLGFLVSSTFLYSTLAFGQSERHLDCEPYGYDGTPSIEAEISQNSRTLNNVIQTRLFEAGPMESVDVGTIFAQPQMPNYNTNVFILYKLNTLKELFILPTNLALIADNIKFKALYEENSLVNSKYIIVRRSLKCTLYSAGK